VVGLVGVVGVVLVGLATNREAAGRSASLAAAVPATDPLGPPPSGGLVVPQPRLLSALADGAALWAPVLHSVALRETPSPGGRIVGRVAASTPERTENIVLVTGATRARGGLWVPIRAEGASGWAPRTALGGYEAVATRLFVDTRAFTATLRLADDVVFRAPIGVGTGNAPTPTGSFYVRNVLTRYRSAFYGPVAFGTSARSTLTDWPAGGFVGIHGTDRPDLVPGRISHGCIRMRNEDILALARLMPVGTPVEIT
jgi:hypothetical protein